jgi:hypothetical protein
MNPKPITLAGRHARLEPLEPHHAEELFKMGRDERIWTHMTLPPPVDLADMQKWIQTALTAQAAGTQLPFAIVSLADMVESASRSLEKPTPQKIESLVNELIEERITDRQLNECDLTLAELKVIAERFRFTLMMMLHSRIAYPKQGPKTAVSREEPLRPDVMAATRKPETAPPVSAA